MNPMFHVTNPVYTYRVPPTHPTEFTTYHLESIPGPMQNNPRLPLQQQQQLTQTEQLQQPPKSACDESPPTTSHTAPRRGRKSAVPPEQREQLRRLKKQNMERRRRACISDKMNALHSMAMSVVGIDPNEHQKVEKADILGICYTVLEGIAKIADERPELRSQLHGLRSYLRDHTTQTPPIRCTDEHSQSSVGSEEIEERVCKPDPDSCLVIDMGYDDKENQTPQSPPVLIRTPSRSASSRFSIPNSLNWHSTPSNACSTPQNSEDSGYPSSAEKGLGMNRYGPFRSPSVERLPKTGERSAFRAIKPTATRSSTSPSVWRPYLDD
ncbi:hypothetical protein D915_001981 [Fasciola hepatica]|uniref:BHLH domain-containing protein n=1 Tax=Fasciola hepatica TaxID=6192 RepID=A0A4E0RID3_FASHE|nr:hypothetical protein D915_001981 [Fasciola hepatica]